MEEMYNYETGRFRAKHRGIISFDLDIRKPITQIVGCSATGKSLLVSCIRVARNSNRYNSTNVSDASNVLVFDESFSVSELYGVSNSLIVIDRCDLILDKPMLDFIAADRKNCYLLFSRTVLPLGLSPNYYGTFEKIDNKVSISYKFSEVCWQ